MRGKSKIALLTALSLMLMPINIVSAADNMPNTSLSDTDKTSSCEVTADVHYAYYVSMPAHLTLEPYDYDNITSTTGKALVRWLELYGHNLDEESYYISNYKVKAKTTTSGLNGKYIMVQPIWYYQSGGREFCSWWDSISGNLLTFFMDSVESQWGSGELSLVQDKLYFGETNSEKIERVSSNNWTETNGTILAELETGKYRCEIEFEYGLVDSIEY